MQHAEPHQNSRKNRLRMISAYDWVSALIFAMLIISLLITFVARSVMVEGPSMLPTLTEGDRLLLTRASSSYEKGDIIVVDRYTESPLIKRIIAVAGDTVEITKDFRLSINGEIQLEPYAQGINVPRDMTGPQTVPEGCVFVLGDNRGVSKDSRMNEVGMISVKDIVGRAIFRVWPLSKFGKLEGF